MIKYSIVDCEKLDKEDLAYISNNVMFYDTKVAIFHGERQINDEKFNWTLQALTPKFFVCWFSLSCPVSFVVSSASATTAQCAYEMALDGVFEFCKYFENVHNEEKNK